MSYTLTQAKALVINQGYAIKNDDSVEKLRKVLRFCFPCDTDTTKGNSKYYVVAEYDKLQWDGLNEKNFSNSINLSEIELPKQITIEMVIDLRKQYPNNLEFGDAFDKLLNN